MATNQAKPQKKPSHGPMWLLGRIAVVAAVAYLVVAFVMGQMQVAQKQRELSEVNAQVQMQAEENTELQRIVDSKDESAYIEKRAREMGYARPDERVYVDISGE